MKRDLCPACSAPLVKVNDTDFGWWAVCPRCDGMIGTNVTDASAIRRLGPLAAWDEGNDMSNPATCRYFDVTYAAGGRTHGWYNPVTGKLVQIG